MLVVAIALGEDLGMRGFLHHMPAVHFFSWLLGRCQILRRSQVLHFLQLFLRFVALERDMPETKITQFHLKVAIAVFRRVCVGVEDETATDWHVVVALPPEAGTAGHHVAIH